MKASKLITIILAVVLVLSCVSVFAACDAKTYEIAVVTDVGQLMDGGFNQGTYEGAEAYAKAHNISYNYYQPANGSDATDADRIAAMRTAITNGAKIIVAPGFLQATAMTTVASENPDVKFVFIDGWVLTDESGKALENITAVAYKEEESGYMAGYAAVMDGYTNLGGTFGGGGSNPACNRFAMGYVQGAAAAAAAKDVNVSVKISFQYGASFSASNELQAQISGWYTSGTQVVFACGGSMFSSVKAAADENNGKIIGVDVDQAKLSDKVLTSAVKGLSASVEKILGQIYNNEWSKLGGQLSNLGAADNATGLPTAADSWRFSSFTTAQYNTLFDAIKAGSVSISTDGCFGDCNTATLWTGLVSSNTHITVTFE